MIYYSAIGTNGGDKDPIILNMESPTIRYNFAEEGLIKFGNCDNTNKFRIYGEDQSGIIECNGFYINTLEGLSQYYGGPVISFANDPGYNPHIEMFEYTETSINLSIEKNYVGDSNAIVSDLKNLNASSSITFTGKLTIRNNFTIDNSTNKRQANINVKPTLTFDADESLDPTTVYLYFNTDVTNAEMPLTKWNFNINGCLANPSIEHYYADNRAPEN